MKRNELNDMLQKRLQQNQELLESTEEYLATLDQSTWSYRVYYHLKGYYTGRVDELIVIINRLNVLDN